MQPQKFPTLLLVVLTIILLSLTLASSAWAAEYKVLYRFGGWEHNPLCSLTFDAVGNLYGTATYGGTRFSGTVFKLTPNPDGSWTESTLYSFLGETDGAYPEAGLIFDAVGNLYGTTAYGGAGPCHNGCGTVFKLVPNPDGTWTESVIHTFLEIDGEEPRGGLIFDATGNLYGTTWGGGAHGAGTVFRLATNPDGRWTRKVLHSFHGGMDGANPKAVLALDSAGTLYGTTVNGGVADCSTYGSGCGTVFQLSQTPDGPWQKTRLHTFKGKGGANPFAGLIFDAARNLYGTTRRGGASDAGTVFKLAPNPDGSWTESKLHTFNKKDGAEPVGDLIFDASGNLHGTTRGSYYDWGSVFKLAPQPDGHWIHSKLHAFKNGQFPWAGMVLDSSGNLYGTTVFGGDRFDDGVVFKITP